MLRPSTAARPEHKSLYPEEWGVFPYMPMSDTFRVIDAGGSGEALQSLARFIAGDTVFAFRGVLMHEQTLHTLQLAGKDDWFLHDPYASGLMLHHCEPNVKICMERQTAVATRLIAPNDIISMDYETTEDELFRPFDCLCSSDKCRGVIKGRKFLVR